MVDEVRAKIARWFDENGDGEFECLPRTAPYSVIAPTSTSRRVLYTTKFACAARLLGAALEGSSLGIVGRYGLPTEDDIPWLRDFIGHGRLHFLGDCDPSDLMIFAWLRTCFHVEFLGVGDRLISDLCVPVSEASTIRLADAEMEAIPLLHRAVPDFRDLAGPTCSSLMDRGRKIELEAIAAFGTTGASSILDVLCA